MIVTTWNTRGLNDPAKVAAVKKLLSDHNIDVIGIIETKVKAHRKFIIQKKFGRN